MTTLTNIAKHAASLANRVKNLLGYLLKEDGGYLLLETGGRIIISGAALTGTPKHTAALTGVPKT